MKMTRAALWGGVSMGLMACAGNNAQALQQLQRLRETVDGLRGQLVRYDARIEELSAEFVVLQEGVVGMRERLQEAPVTVPEDLQVVHLQPQLEGHQEPDVTPPPVEISVAYDGNLVADVTDQAPPQAFTIGDEALAQRGFRDALKAFQQGRTTQALQGLENFLETYPSHSRAASAWYWMGECHFEAQDYRAAAQAFRQVVDRFPASSKAPDALLRMGLALERLRDFDRSRSAFAELIAAYPRTALADLARVRLAEHPGEPR